MRVLKLLWDWLVGVLHTARHPEHPAKIQAEFADDIPEHLPSGKLYVVGEEGHYWCAAMRCPCGCGEAIHLSLVKNDDPSWLFSLDRRKQPSLFPSVWRTVGCGSHFILRRGNILWY